MVIDVTNTICEYLKYFGACINHSSRMLNLFSHLRKAIRMTDATKKVKLDGQSSKVWLGSAGGLR